MHCTRLAKKGVRAVQDQSEVGKSRNLSNLNICYQHLSPLPFAFLIPFRPGILQLLVRGMTHADADAGDADLNLYPQIQTVSLYLPPTLKSPL